MQNGVAQEAHMKVSPVYRVAAFALAYSLISGLGYAQAEPVDAEVRADITSDFESAPGGAPVAQQPAAKGQFSGTSCQNTTNRRNTRELLTSPPIAKGARNESYTPSDCRLRRPDRTCVSPCAVDRP